MNAETKFLQHLIQRGYFEKRSFDPELVFEAAQKFLAIDVTSAGENDRLSIFINHLVKEGVLQFEYSKDPALHPKEVLDHWRLVLTSAGHAALKSAPTSA